MFKNKVTEGLGGYEKICCCSECDCFSAAPREICTGCGAKNHYKVGRYKIRVIENLFGKKFKIVGVEFKGV